DTLLENDGTHAEKFMAKFDFSGEFQWLYTFNEWGVGSIEDFVQVGNKIKIGGFMADDWRIGDDTLREPPGMNGSYFAQFTDSSVILPTVVAPPFVEAVFPNPTEDRLHLQLLLPQSGALSARIFDAAGRLVKSFRWAELEAGAQALQITDLALPNGLYFLQLQAADLQKTVRVLVQH
ncbi:MAG: T9SS type A sorting domain-containing protein, partial [Methylococcales bacterium]|nr:T9SS type A sorting domain-containing protein [Methylococcales bacterium]